MPPRKKPSDGPRPPTAGEVIALFNLKQADGNEARLRTLAETFRVLVRMEHDVRIPETYKAISREVHTPYVRDAWLRTTAALTQNDWHVHFDPKSETDKDKRAGGVAERWSTAATDAMNKDRGLDVPHEACLHMVRDCESVIKVVHRPDAWATFPARAEGEDPTAYVQKAESYKKGSPIPYAWANVDRLSYLPGEGEFGEEWCIEYGEFSRRYLANRYSMYEDPVTGKLVGKGHEEEGRTAHPSDLEGKPSPQGMYSGTAGMSTKVEYFDSKWWCVVVDGSYAPGFPKENPYAPKLPYFRARPSDEPEAVLYSLLFLVPRLDELLTMWLNWAYLGAYPNPLLQDLPSGNALPPGMLPPRETNQQPDAFVWKPGRMLEVPPGKQFGFMQPPPIGSDIKELAQVFRSLIDIAGIPSILRGANLSGDSGYLANQMISAATMLYKRLQKARERQLEQAIDFMLYLIPHRIKQTVYVLGPGEDGRTYLGLRAKGAATDYLAAIDQLGPITVSAPPDMSVMRQANAMIAKQLTEGPPETRLLSRRRAMETVMGEEDPDTIIDEIWVENEMATNPMINARVVEDAMRRANFVITPPAASQQLVGPDGVTPLVPGGIPGQVAGGLPVAPGMGMPMQPPTPGGGMLPGGHPGGGTYPGQPPNAPVGA